MSKSTMAALGFGIVAFLFGLGFLYAWRQDVIVVFKGSLGPMLAIGGMLVIAIAWSEYQAAREMERLTAQTQPTPPAPTPPPAPAQPTPSEQPSEQQPSQQS